MTEKEKKDALMKEIDLIQGCINRMAQNSFVIKGWLITLVTVILALLPEKINIDVLCAVIILATGLFWYLDAFFLKTEKLYRMKYEWVIKNRKSTESHLYDLNPYNDQMWLKTIAQEDIVKNNEIIIHKGEEMGQKSPGIFKVMFSKTLWPLYGLIILFAIAVWSNNHFHFFTLAQSALPQQTTDIQQNIFSFIKQ